MTDAESGQEEETVTHVARSPRMGVAPATSTSKEASCSPASTTSSSHCTSPSMSCWSPAGDPATHPSWPTASSSAWPWRKSCSATTPNAAGCGQWPTGWGTCSPTSAARPPTTAGCAAPGRCGTSRRTVNRSELAGWAGYGRDASHHRFYWGLKLSLLVCPDGMPVAWCLANPNHGEREVAEALLDRAARQQVLRPGLVILADKGLAGRAFQQLVGELGAVLARPDRKDEPYRFGSLGGVRQWVEAIFDTLKDQLGLERHGAHTVQGVWIRVAQRLLALAAGVWFNWQINAPVKRSLVAYDH